MFARDAIVQAVGAVRGLQIALLTLADANADVVMPGYTHLQRAQPVLFAHALLAYFEMLDRDAGRFADAFERTDVMPLGSAALAGAAYPLDREAVARELGFTEISRNSIDAVADRDFILEFQSAAAICMVHISRLCEDLVLWSSAEFGFPALADQYATGSSIMPQKRNPDVAELARGKTGRVVGHLTALLTMLKGLPLAYNRDLQEDKPGLLRHRRDADRHARGVARRAAHRRVRRGARAPGRRVGPLHLATDYADYLTRKGLPFRTAHQVVGGLVRVCEARGAGLGDLDLAELQAASPLFEADAVGMTVEQALAAPRRAGRHRAAPRRAGAGGGPQAHRRRRSRRGRRLGRSPASGRLRDAGSSDDARGPDHPIDPLG